MDYEHDRSAWNVLAEGYPTGGTRREQLTFLLRYAILAPSSHNSQPWLFHIAGTHIDVSVNEARWLHVADADQRELHISAGCALENLLVAAERFGFGHETSYFPEPSNRSLVARVRLVHGVPARPRGLPLFTAITTRHTNRGAYEPRRVPAEELASLRAAVWEPDLRLVVIEDAGLRRTIDALTVRADMLQFADPAWRQELGEWLGAGAFGQPWLVAKMARLAVTALDLGTSTSRKDVQVLDNAPAIALVASLADGPEVQVRAGQSYERVALTAEVSGLRTHPMNQVLQIPELKAQLADLLPGPRLVPQLVFRLGHGPPEKKHSPRRPLEALIG